MGKVVLWFLLLVAVCYASAEVDIEESPPTETTTVANTPLPTKAAHLTTEESTSDTWLELHPWATNEYTTTSATPSIAITESEQALNLQNEGGSSEESDVKDAATLSEKDCSDLSQKDMQKLANAMTSFSKNLLATVYQQNKDPNVVLSPFSVAMGLLQLTLGARARTENELLKTLHMESLPCLHDKMKKLISHLLEDALSVATRIYLSKCLKIREEFLEKSEEIYKSKPLKLVSDAKENVKAINKWVSDATKGKIKDFIEELPKNIDLILLNAIYFKGIWKNKFDPKNTYSDGFYINDKDIVMVDMMQAVKYPLSYYLSDKLDSMVAKLPFKGNMSFVIVMPNQNEWNMSKILENLNINELNSRLLRERPTTLRMPKLNIKYKLELSKALSSLGLAGIFANQGIFPDFSGITKDSLYVDSIQHESVLDLNEEGVEAAATTAVLASRSLSTFSVNRPFLFFLIQDNLNLPLFYGYVREPQPGTLPKRDFVPMPDVKISSKGFMPK